MESMRPANLWGNGAADPALWHPHQRNIDKVRVPRVGDLIGWQYGGWRVFYSEHVDDVDVRDDERVKLEEAVGKLPPERRAKQWERLRPRRVALRHEVDPLILLDGQLHQRLHDGAVTIHFRTMGSTNHRWSILTDPYQVCSCHRQIWPCQEIDRAEVAAHYARRMEHLLASAQPGMCAACQEPITGRHKTVTFPEESRYVPGFPGPTYHAGRAGCWAAAEKYERSGRLVDNPDVVRVASCPGLQFIHEARTMPAAERMECTAGPECTGLHGPSGYRREMPCWEYVQLADAPGAHARPGLDCGYRGGYGVCLGADLSQGGTSLSPTAGDIVWRNQSGWLGL